MASTYFVVFPPSVEHTLQAFSFVNLQLDGLGLPLGCIALRSYRAKLLATMLAPPALMGCYILVGWVRRDRSHERKHREGRASRATEDGPARPTGMGAHLGRVGAEVAPDFELLAIAFSDTQNDGR